MLPEKPTSRGWILIGRVIKECNLAPDAQCSEIRSTASKQRPYESHRSKRPNPAWLPNCGSPPTTTEVLQHCLEAILGMMCGTYELAPTAHCSSLKHLVSSDARTLGQVAFTP